MHASLWRFSGAPDDLLRRYDAVLAELGVENMRLHLCLRAHNGIVLVDTCPSKGIFDQFVKGTFDESRKRHGLPEPEQLEDYPVHVAFAQGRRLD